MLRRQIAAYAKRVAQADPYDLEDMLDVADLARHAIADAVDGLRAQGYSWQEIADGAQITRQAAQQRWGKPLKAVPTKRGGT